MTERIVPNEVVVKANASLQKEIEKELQTPDPDKDKASAAFKEALNEST